MNEITPTEVKAVPPNFAEIVPAFPEYNIVGKPILFAYGTIVYNPAGITIPPWLWQHEKVHMVQQEGRPKEWWAYYINNPQFRLREETLAHWVELRSFFDHNKDRNARARYMYQVAMRLAGPLYGGLISFAEAKRLVCSAALPPKVTESWLDLGVVAIDGFHTT